MTKRKVHTRYTNKDGIIVPSVTTVIGNNLGWNKQVLVAWSISQCKKGLDPNKTRDTAADTGTLCHKYIECFIHGAMDDPELEELKTKATMEQIVIAEKAIEQWKEYCDANEVTVLESEIKFVSEQYQYGGTIDIVANVKGVLSLCDIKTSKNIYSDHLIQLSAYKQGLIECTSYQPEQYIFFHIPKEFDNETQYIKPITVDRSTIEDSFDVFQSLLQINNKKDLIHI